MAGQLMPGLVGLAASARGGPLAAFLTAWSVYLGEVRLLGRGPAARNRAGEAGIMNALAHSLDALKPVFSDLGRAIEVAAASADSDGSCPTSGFTHSFDAPLPWLADIWMCYAAGMRKPRPSVFVTLSMA